MKSIHEFAWEYEHLANEFDENKKLKSVSPLLKTKYVWYVAGIADSSGITSYIRKNIKVKVNFMTVEYKE